MTATARREGVRTLTHRLASRLYRGALLRAIGTRTVAANLVILDGGLVIDSDDAIVHHLTHEWTPRPAAVSLSNCRRAVLSGCTFTGGDTATKAAR